MVELFRKGKWRAQQNVFVDLQATADMLPLRGLGCRPDMKIASDSNVGRGGAGLTNIHKLVYHDAGHLYCNRINVRL
jgi:hypothetical protein